MPSSCFHLPFSWNIQRTKGGLVQQIFLKEQLSSVLVNEVFKLGSIKLCVFLLHKTGEIPPFSPTNAFKIWLRLAGYVELARLFEPNRNGKIL